MEFGFAHSVRDCLCSNSPDKFCKKEDLKGKRLSKLDQYIVHTNCRLVKLYKLLY